LLQRLGKQRPDGIIDRLRRTVPNEPRCPGVAVPASRDVRVARGAGAASPMTTVSDCTAPIRAEAHPGRMDDHILTAAETTAVIVVNTIRTHTSLCIPGTTDVRPAGPLAQPSSRAADLNGTEARPNKASGGSTAE
jgi:hypothetical protein